MAGSGGRSTELPTSRADSAGGKRRSQRWEVEFARYFATPRRSPSTAPPPGLRYVSRGRNRLHGTWLPAASTAALCISRPSHSFAAHVLTVSIGDVVYEEHYVSILNFSWPQVACVTECPVRGSRVVFVSFCDRSKQIQKFAVRFPHLGDAESFLNSVKELSSNTMDVIPSGSDCVYEYSSSSEHIASDGPQYRPDEVASFEEPTSDHRTDASSLGYPEELDQSVLPSPLATNIDSSYSGYLHSYSEMPTGYSIKNEKVSVNFNTCNSDINVPCPATATGHAPEKACTLDTCHDAAAAVAGTELIADKGKVAAKEIDDILAGIKTYGGGDSFNAFPSLSPVRRNLMLVHLFAEMLAAVLLEEDGVLVVNLAIIRLKRPTTSTAMERSACSWDARTVCMSSSRLAPSMAERSVTRRLGVPAISLVP